MLWNACTAKFTVVHAWPVHLDLLLSLSKLEQMMGGLVERTMEPVRKALQDAKNRFSEVVEEALHKGPQWITRRGEDAV